MLRMIAISTLLLAFVTTVRAESAHPLTLLPGQPAVTGDQVPTVHSPGKPTSGKPVIVAFFASWCPPCADEFKALNEVRAKFPADQIPIVAVNLFEKWGGQENPLRMKRFLQRTKPKFHVIKGNKKIAAAFGNITRVPSLVVYNAAGREIWRFVHEPGATKMSATADEIIAALGPDF